MPTTYYETVNGKIISQTCDGVYTSFETDALGSITATVDENGQVINTYRYKPSGALLAKTGIGEDPSILWTGATGSQHTGLKQAEQYNQHRHYSHHSGWTSSDPIWPIEMPYVYVKSNPITHLDPSGFGIEFNNCDNHVMGSLKNCCEVFNNLDAAKIATCLMYSGWGHHVTLIPQVLEYLKKRCKSENENTCVFCQGPAPDNSLPDNLPSSCHEYMQKACNQLGVSANAGMLLDPNVSLHPNEGALMRDGKYAPSIQCHANPTGCGADLRKNGCIAAIVFCWDSMEFNHWLYGREPNRHLRERTCATLAHEMIHSSGLLGSAYHDDYLDIVHAMSKCIGASLGAENHFPVQFPKKP